MGRPPFSEEQIEAQREAVIHAAEGLFAELGYDGVTMRAIAKMTGQSAAAAYRYFENKDAIFNAARVAAYGRFTAAQEASLAGAQNSVEELSQIGDAYIQFALDEPDAYRLMFEMKPSDATRTPEVEECGAAAFKPIRDTIARAIEAGVLVGDHVELAHLFWAGLHGIVSLHVSGKLRHGFDLMALRDPMKHLLLAGGQGPPTV